MRGVSEPFIQTLKTGFLSPIVERVNGDVDLDLETRENYLNIYYKGNSLLRLEEAHPACYRVEIHPKFLGRTFIPDLVDAESVRRFLDAIPTLKENIQVHGRSSVETEYEQLARYYDAIQKDPERIVLEAERLLRQKLELGPFNLPQNRLEAMKTLGSRI